MANETVQVEGPYEVHDFTVSESVLIEKNTLCQLTDPRTASASDGANKFAGISATEHKASVSKTELGLWTTGTHLIFTIGPAISAGAMVSLSGANLVKQATEAEIITGATVGKLLQNATAGTAQAAVEVKIGVFA